MGTLRSRPNVSSGKNLRRYVHTQGFTRLSGNRRVDLSQENLSARTALAIVAAMIFLTGMLFVLF